MRRVASLVLLGLVLVGVDARPAPASARWSAADSALACPGRWSEDTKAYRAVIRTREYKALAHSLPRRFRLAMHSTHDVESVAGRCLAMVGDYVVHPERLELRALFGVDVRSYSVQMQDPVTGEFGPVRGSDKRVFTRGCASRLDRGAGVWSVSRRGVR